MCTDRWVMAHMAARKRFTELEFHMPASDSRVGPAGAFAHTRKWRKQDDLCNRATGRSAAQNCTDEAKYCSGKLVQSRLCYRICLGLWSIKAVSV